MVDWESIIVRRMDFMENEIPQERESFSDEEGKNRLTIEEKNFINSLIKIKINCECDHGFKGIIDVKKIPIQSLLYGSKKKRYRHKATCNSCGRFFFISLKMNELYTKNPQKTIKEHKKEVEIIVQPQNYSPTKLEKKDNRFRIESFQRLIDLFGRRRICLVSNKYEEIILMHEKTGKLISDELSSEYLEEMQVIDREANKFLSNITKILHDELLKKSNKEEESIKKPLKKKRIGIINDM